MVDKIGKTFQFWKDSGFIYAKQLIKNLPSGYRFYWCIPDKIKEDEKVWFTEANENIELIPYPYSTSIHQNRYNFSVATLVKHLPYYKDVDVILNHQPEVSANLKVWAMNQRREQPDILSFYHWIDCEESRKFADELGGYSSRQHDGALASWKNFFHNQYAIDMFRNQMYKEFKVLPNEDSYETFHPSPEKFGEKPFDIPTDKKVILFNHRLNKTTNWKEVLEIADEIYTERQDFVLWFTDDTKLKEINNLKQRPYLIVSKMPSENYGYLIKNSHFSVCNHKGYSTWNTSVIDSINHGCLALIPNREIYKEMFQYSIRDFGCVFAHNGNLKEQMILALNRSREENSSIAEEIKKKDPDLFSFTDGEKIRIMLSHRIPEKAYYIPKKYEDVLNLIKEYKVATKRDWVNKFWSFHVNSNFQTIRYNLLCEHWIEDNTACPETVYKYLEEEKEKFDKLTP
jgi:hypothetical protein